MNGDLVCRLVSHGAPPSPIQVQRTAIDVSQLGAPQNSATESVAENAEIPDATQPVEQTNEEEPVARKKRNRKSYANKKLSANSNLFLNPAFATSFSDENVFIFGQIKQCARADNNFCYRIEWRPPSGFPVDKEHLQTDIPKTEVNMRLIDEAIHREAGQPTILPSGRRKPTKNPRQNGRSVLKTPVPQTIDAAEAAASIRTSSSTVSSITASPVGRATRGSVGETIESDTDDGSDLDEKDNGVDDEDELDSDIEEDENHKSGSDIYGLLRDVQWNFEPMEDDYVDDDNLPEYNGLEGNRRHVNDKFHDLMECLALAGLDETFVARLAANSNRYARKFLLSNCRNPRLYGRPWKNISTAEMYRFLGIMLKISIAPIDGGGYQAYFRQTNLKIFDIEIPHTKGFARQYMSLLRFKQIRAAFHPEDKTVAHMDGRDKCYQLRHAINTFNTAASNLRHLGPKQSFDEGGCSCRSRFCPVRQYNKDKPNKWRVDFFILACAKSWFIHHLDVYQGKNDKNVGIKKEIRGIATTQKAVLNAVLHTRMHLETNGARSIAMDNRYQCPELAMILRQKYGIYSVGTVRANRRGWPKEQLNLQAKKDNSTRGQYKLLIDRNNHVQCLQWVDNKVVNCCTTMLSAEIRTAQRQVGKNKISYNCPLAMRQYQLYMGGVDRGDQMRAHGGGFSNKGHFQKWYKKVYLAILDCMLLNALLVWNDSTTTTNRIKMKRHEFYTYIAQAMMEMPIDDNNQSVPERLHGTMAGLEAHVPEKPKNAKVQCLVCRLERNTGLGGTLVSLKGVTQNVATCSECGISAHNVRLDESNLRKIHSMNEFKGMTCFQIAHTDDGHRLWQRSKQQKRGYEPQTSHPVYGKLRELYRKTARITKKKRTNELLDALHSDSDDGMSDTEIIRQRATRTEDV